MISSKKKLKGFCHLTLKATTWLAISSHALLVHAVEENGWLRLNGAYQDVAYKNMPVDGDGIAMQGIGWLPLYQDEEGLAFAQGQFSFLEGGVLKQGSLMLGHRQYLSGNRIGGYWLGYDFIDLGIPQNLNQFSFGLEMLSTDWDLRAAFRMPDDYLGSHVAASSTTSSTTNTTSTAGSSSSYLDYLDDYTGISGFEAYSDANVWYRTDSTTTQTSSSEVTTTSHLLRQRFYAFNSADIEVGYRIPLENHFESEKQTRLSVYAGLNYLLQRDLGEEMGWAARLEYAKAVGKQSTLYLNASHFSNELVGHDNYVSVGIKVPFGESLKEHWPDVTPGQEERAREAVYRGALAMITGTETVETSQSTQMLAPTVTTTSATTLEKVSDAATGVEFDRTVIARSLQELRDATLNEGSNTLIVTTNDAATGSWSAVDTSDRVVLSDFQTVLGGAAQLQVNTVVSGLNLTLDAPSVVGTATTPTYNFAYGASGQAAINMANNTHLLGMNLTGAGVATNYNLAVHAGGTAGDVMTNVVIENNTISDFGGTGTGGDFRGSGINILYADGVTVQNNTLSENNYQALRIDSSNDVTIDGNTISDSTTLALYAEATSNLIITNNLFNNPGGVRTAQSAIWVASGGSNINIANNTIDNYQLGISLSSTFGPAGSLDNVIIKDNSLTNMDTSGSSFGVFSIYTNASHTLSIDAVESNGNTVSGGSNSCHILGTAYTGSISYNSTLSCP